MTPRTRTSNKNADYKVYYAKKVPKQKYFPHRRKTVRPKAGAGQDEPDKRQMRFLPEKMRGSGFVRDSDYDEEDLEEDMEEGGVELTPQPTVESRIGAKNTSATKGKKRTSGEIKEESEEGEGQVRSRLKRRRRAPTAKDRRQRVVHDESESENGEPVSPADHEPRADIQRTLRRQSTMTQLVDGRRPSPSSKEPEFKPVKRGPRSSWSGRRKGNDKQQRTLTQMVPGLVSLGSMSDDDTEEEEEAATKDADSQADDGIIVQHLVQSGSFQADEGGHPIEDDNSRPVQDSGTQSTSTIIPDIVEPCTIPSNDGSTEELDTEDEYHPTQFIDAPTPKLCLTPRRVSGKENLEPSAAGSDLRNTRKSARHRFGLLSTPEKRRIREIPSSQSPPESPLSTQVSPQKAIRSPLKERSKNAMRAPDTPSKRKQVTFQEPAASPKAAPTPKRRVGNVVLDSEDEDEELTEEDLADEGPVVGPHTQVLLHKMDNPISGVDIGAETQALLQQIDHACVQTEEDVEFLERGDSEELGEPHVLVRTSHPSQELGEQVIGSNIEDVPLHTQRHSPYHSAHPAIKQEQSESAFVSAITPQDAMDVDQVAVADEMELPLPAEDMPSSPPIDLIEPEDANLSSPLIIKDETSDEEDMAPTPQQPIFRRPPSPPAQHQESTDLDGEPIQVPRSPTLASHETQQSHSSKAEQQLQSEYQTYSQYRHAPPSSSMHAQHDPFTYQATPFAPHAPAPEQAAGLISQATTVDCTQTSPKTTPKKAISRSQPVVSANTTPHKVLSSSPLVSPQRPPPLFIPSSFPTPGRARMEIWSSPVLLRNSSGSGSGISQVGASIEDFSIPPLPPMDDFEDDELE